MNFGQCSLVYEMLVTNKGALNQSLGNSCTFHYIQAVYP